jgi:predicted site-specific integrase-resolvase
MKLADWARANGLTYKTAWRMWAAGKLPVRAEQLPTGSVIVHVSSFDTALELAMSLPTEDRRRLVAEVEQSLAG